jgi:hypothetical protein
MDLWPSDDCHSRATTKTTSPSLGLRTATDAECCTRRVGSRLGGEGGAPVYMDACMPWPDAPRSGSEDSRLGWRELNQRSTRSAGTGQHYGGGWHDTLLHCLRWAIVPLSRVENCDGRRALHAAGGGSIRRRGGSSGERGCLHALA